MMEMMMETNGIPPKSVTRLLRLDGLAVALAAIAAYAVTGGNWWLFAALILAPDLAMLGLLAGEKTGARIYNMVHSYTLPIVLGAVGHFTDFGWMLPVALIWTAHIGIDRAVGYGLKYPHAIQHTHLGVMGKARKADTLANAG
jgi:hypothetical protein